MSKGAYQNNPTPTYCWGLGIMTSSLSIKVEGWYKSKKEVVRNARASYIRNPVLIRWYADGEPMSQSY